MSPADHVYFQTLCKRIADGDTVDLEYEPTEELVAIAAKCHENVDAWVKLKPGRKAVRGWLVQADYGHGRYLLAAHSIGWEDGLVYDFTPQAVPPGDPVPRNKRRFVRHDGTESGFTEFRGQEWSQLTYPQFSSEEILLRSVEPEFDDAQLDR